MNSFEIFKLIEQDFWAKKDFIGVLARDQLPENIKYPASFIINTDTSNKAGQHWLAIYYKKNGVCEFFDPLGFSPKYYKFDSYLEKTSIKYFYNTQQLQGIFSEFCGHYCVLYLYIKSRNFNLKYFLNLFTKNTNINDKMITDIFKELYLK